MTQLTYTVYCTWDAEASCWVATSDDVPGLATGADTLEALVERLRVVIPELLEANGLLNPAETADVPFKVVAERDERAVLAA
jgi:predicted RNase H-like HicB family nuclease